MIKYLLVCDTVPGTVVEACWLTGPWTSPPLAWEGVNSKGPSQTSPHWLVCQNSKRDWKVKLIPINYSINITIAVFHNAYKNETLKTVNNFMTLQYTAVCCWNSIYIWWKIDETSNKCNGNTYMYVPTFHTLHLISCRSVALRKIFCWQTGELQCHP